MFLPNNLFKQIYIMDCDSHALFLWRKRLSFLYVVLSCRSGSVDTCLDFSPQTTVLQQVKILMTEGRKSELGKAVYIVSKHDDPNVRVSRCPHKREI